MPSFRLPVVPARARCQCLHALHQHGARGCTVEGCDCGDFQDGGGLAPHDAGVAASSPPAGSEGAARG